MRTINEPYVSRLLRLTLLAPDILEAILDGGPAQHHPGNADAAAAGLVE